MHLLPKLFRSVVDEKLTANVTITPHISFSDFKQLVSNPTNNSLDYWIKKGEQSTWPLLALIRNRTSIELALDRRKYGKEERLHIVQKCRRLGVKSKY